jgi:protease-4
VEVRGEIAADSEASAELLVAALKSAFEDAGAMAVVLRINSPGGSPVQSGIINDEIKRLKAKHKKKVYAVVEEMCASGAYYIAVAADEIYVDKASIVGSIACSPRARTRPCSTPSARSTRSTSAWPGP